MLQTKQSIGRVQRDLGPLPTDSGAGSSLPKWARGVASTDMTRGVRPAELLWREFLGHSCWFDALLCSTNVVKTTCWVMHTFSFVQF